MHACLQMSEMIINQLLLKKIQNTHVKVLDCPNKLYTKYWNINLKGMMDDNK